MNAEQTMVREFYVKYGAPVQATPAQIEPSSPLKKSLDRPS
jgi:hypothetical protein